VRQWTTMDGAPLPTRMTVDPDVPNPARIYDWLLGGSHNFAADRAAAAQAVQILPIIPEIARANRHFLRRAVAVVANLGVEQFLDLGSGIPTVGNVHEVAREARPGARVAYVDIDPIAVEQSRSILGDDAASHVLHADLLDVRAVLDDQGIQGLIDFSRPVCVLMVGVAHFLPDSWRLGAAIAAYRERVPSGSYFVMSHGTAEVQEDDVITKMTALYARSGTTLVARDRAEITSLIHGWEPIEPGLVFAPEWRPADDPVAEPAGYSTLAVVARKP